MTNKSEATNDSIAASRRATFKAATTGMRAYLVALALNRVRRGYDWRGCCKRDLCEEFATGKLSTMPGRELRAAIARAKGNAS